MDGLVPNLGSGALTVVAFIIALSVIVAVHEYGHYIVARWSGIKSDVFSLGFGPVLFSKMDRHGTKWQVAAIPLGGYVKFRGDANAASGKDSETIATLSEAEIRQTMHGAPLWARAATVAAGPVFNFILSFVVFFGVLFFSGVPSDPLVLSDIKPAPFEHGLQAGDEIVTVAGQTLPEDNDYQGFDNFIQALPRQGTLDYVVKRGDDQITVQGPFLYPPIIGTIAPRSAASDIDLRVGDWITSVDGKSIYAFDELRSIVEGSNGRPLLLNVWRGGEMLEFALTPKSIDEPQRAEGGFKTQWRIGIGAGTFFEPETQTPDIWPTIQIAFMQIGRIIEGSFSALYHMIAGNISTCNLSGPIGIAETSGTMAAQGTTSFIWFIGVLSTAVGMLNLFPIPVLDGGHLVFFAYEAVVGRPPRDTVLRVLMTIGVAVVLSMMLFGLSNDVLC